MGVSVYRHSPEQLRLATDVEITSEMIRKNKLMSVPKAAGTTHAEDAIPDLMSPDEGPRQQPQQSRSSADRKRQSRWDQLVSTRRGDVKNFSTHDEFAGEIRA